MTPRRRGFTLIELMIVMLIIGILSAIAIPQFKNTKGKARAATLKSDLRNLATAEEAYFYMNNTYTTDTAALKASFSPGVQLTFGPTTPGGWTASITHPQALPLTCAMFMGNVAPSAPASLEGIITCQ